MITGGYILQCTPECGAFLRGVLCVPSFPEFVAPRALLRARHAAVIAAVMVGSGCTVAHAANEGLLETIQVSATRREASTLEVSRAVTVIDADELARRAPLTVVDHLRGEPGTYVQQTTPGQGIPIIRGLKGSEVLHLVDGFRLNHAIFRNAPNQYVALVDPWNLERIEAVRGPMSTLYGGDAMGGVVQFFSRSPSFTGDTLQARGQVAVQAATADSRTSTQIEGELGTDRWTAHGGVTWQDAAELRVGGGDVLPDTAFGAHGAHAKMTFAPTAEQTLIVQGQYMERPDTPRHDALVPGFGQTEPDSSELYFRPQQRYFGQIRWIIERPTYVADTMDLQVGYQRIVDDRTSRDFESPIREWEHNASTLVGFVAHLTRQVGAEHLVTYGVEAYHDTVESSRQRMDIESSAVSARPGRFPDDSTMRWVGAYVADQWSLQRRWQLTAGVRFTAYDIALPSTLDDRGVEMDPQDLSGHLGLVFRATDALSLVANAGRGFRPPNIFDLGTFGARGNRFSIPNPNLEAESVFTYDFGVKFSAESARAELMVFRSEYEDKITQVLTGEADASGRLIVQARNATRLQLQGVEAGGLWQITPSASLYGTATWTWGEEQFESQTYAADRIAPLFGKLVARFLVGASWTLESALYWAGEQDRLSPRDAVDPRIDPKGTAGWATLGVRATWQPLESLSLAAGIDNLMDRRYREHGSGFDAPGRNGFVSVEWAF